MNIRSYASLLAVTFVLLLFQCSDEGPRKIGGDGAVLTKVNLSNAQVLISKRMKGQTEFGGEARGGGQQLLTVDFQGNSENINFSISGTPNGGFDDYIVSDINEKYFLISFYLRRESYFIEKSNGNALASAYIDFMYVSSSAEHGVYGNTFYYRGADNEWHKVENYLDAGAQTTKITFGHSLATRLFFDKSGGLYSQGLEYSPDTYPLYYHNNGRTVVVDDYVRIWNDLDGNLKVMFDNGDITIASNGVLTNAGNLGTSVEAGATFKTINFKSHNKSIALYTLETTGEEVVYDLLLKKTILNLGSLGNGTSIAAADSFGKFLYLICKKDQQNILLKINVEDYAVDSTGLTEAGQGDILDFYSTGEKGRVVVSCVKDPPFIGLCNWVVSVTSESGKVDDKISGPFSGVVVKLHYP